ERAGELVRAGVDVIVIDSSHGHSHNVRNALIQLKKLPGMVDIVVGNIATGKAARFLMDVGADGLRVGIGSGSTCITRIVTGCGVPQITANISVYEEIGDEIPFCSDGGVRFSGDIVKALASGASSVMSGFIFAATEETPGETFPHKGQLYKRYRGMGSESVIKEGGERYGAKAVPEGIDGAVLHRGPAARQIGLILGGLRQGMGYVGCRTIDELRHKAVFMKLSGAGVAESHVHDILITNEAPNYQVSPREE
ncbi:MAG: IMP dehydrogenase, partial [Patescibacteria group bacterium]